MSRDDTESDEDIGVFFCGERFRYSRKEIVAGKGEQHREFEDNDPCTVLHITLYRERKMKEKDPRYYPVEEESPSQIKIYVESMTPGASLGIELGTDIYSREIVISGGSQSNSHSSWRNT
jgi:hypothetical protein